MSVDNDFISPFSNNKSSFDVFNISDALFDNLVFNSFRAPNIELPATKLVREACTPTSHGFTFVSVLITFILFNPIPNSSDAIMAKTVSDPCPISLDPVITVRKPYGSILRVVPHPSDG